MSGALAVDLGGTNVRVGLVDEAGVLVRSARERVGSKAPEAVADQIVRLAHGIAPALPAGPVVVAVAGSVWSGRGMVENAPNLDWRAVPLGDLLGARLGRTTRLVNDLNAITYAEAKVGSGQGASDVACVFVGTGLGLGLVCGGRLLEGADGLAPELGHIKVVPPDRGRLCGCGQRGCVEAYVSGAHLPALLAETAREAVRADVTAGSLEAAAQRGEPAALALWTEVAEKLAFAIGAALMVANPSVLVLGGGVLASAPSLVARVRSRLADYAWPAFTQHTRVTQSSLGDDAGLVGAGLLGSAAD